MRSKKWDGKLTEDEESERFGLPEAICFRVDLMRLAVNTEVEVETEADKDKGRSNLGGKTGDPGGVDVSRMNF